MRNLILAFALGFTGCASAPMNCEEACAFERMVCKGAVVSESRSVLQNIFGQTDGVSENTRTLSYQCEVDYSKADFIKKVRQSYFEKNGKKEKTEKIGILSQ